MLENYAFSGTPNKPISYIEQGTNLLANVVMNG
jgi:hypothetical protein